MADLSPRQRQFLDRVKIALEAEFIDVPAPKDLARSLGTPPQAVEEIIRIGVGAGEIVPVAPGLFFTPGQLRRIAERLLEGSGGGAFDPPTAREILAATRRVVTPVLEYFDECGITCREGGLRTVQAVFGEADRSADSIL